MFLKEYIAKRERIAWRGWRIWIYTQPAIIGVLVKVLVAHGISVMPKYPKPGWRCVCCPAVRHPGTLAEVDSRLSIRVKCAGSVSQSLSKPHAGIKPMFRFSCPVFCFYHLSVMTDASCWLDQFIVMAAAASTLPIFSGKPDPSKILPPCNPSHPLAWTGSTRKKSKKSYRWYFSYLEMSKVCWWWDLLERLMKGYDYTPFASLSERFL